MTYFIPEAFLTISGGKVSFPAGVNSITLSTPLPVSSGGTGTSTPSLIAGTNITSITGSWPNQTINAANQTTTPGGATTQLQYNNGGVFGGTVGLTWNSGLGNLTLTAGGTFTAPHVVTDSVKGSSGDLSIIANTDDTTAIRFLKANGSTTVVDIDTLNSRVGINNSAPAVDLDVTGQGQFSNTLILNSGSTALSLPLGGGATFTSPASAGNTTGGNLTLTAGAVSGGNTITSAGGSLTLTSGDSSTNSKCSGGTLILTSGSSSGNTSTGGSLVMTSGNGFQNRGGSITLKAGNVVGGGDTQGGSLTLTTGTASEPSGDSIGGSITLTTDDISSAGSGHSTRGGSILLSSGSYSTGGGSIGGGITLTSGVSSGGGGFSQGGSILLTCGSGGSGGDTGGNITLTSFTPANGGSIVLTGTGTNGFINLANAIDWTATSAPALSASGHGRIYYDSGTQSFKQSSNGGAYTPLGAVTSITGTANQVIASSSTGAVILSLPQSISLTSSPAFQNLTLGTTTLGGLVLNDTEGIPKTVTIEAPTTVTTSYILKMPVVQGSVNTALINDGSGNLSWGTASVPQYVNYVVGTPSGSYNGSTTVFGLPFSYTADGKNLEVFYNGQALIPTNDYTETSTTSITTTQALIVGTEIAFRTVVGSSIVAPVTLFREDYVVGTALNNYTGSLTVFNLVNSYNVGGHVLIVTLDGDVQTAGVSVDYLETSSSIVTFNNALVTGQKVSFIWSQTTGASSGTVNSGTTPSLAYYAATSSTVSAVAANATMNGNKIINLANGTVPTDAAAVGQIRVPVIVQYSGTPTGTLTNSDNLVTYPTQNIDTNSAYSAGTFVVPKTGYYLINAAIEVAGTVALNTVIQISIYHNGSVAFVALWRSQASVSGENYPATVTGILNCLASDTVAIYAQTTATTPTYVGSNYSFLNISSIG
ncbi:MAG: beta strand repeat-containing protein [bacterium]